MSAPTLTREPSATPPSSPAPARRPDRAPTTPAATAAFGARTPAGRTARTWLGLVLGLTPLFTIISDLSWYVVGVGAMLVTIGPAWALRLWRPESPPRVWQVLPGLLVLLPLYVTAVCVPTGAIGGVIPWKGTWTQLGLLHDELLTTIADSTAPIASTPGIRLALAVLLGVGAVLVDVLCVVLEAPAMVGLVLLPVFVLSGATVREPVALWWFLLAALGYLLLLTTTGPAARPWGRVIGRRPPGARASLVSGRVIGTVAVVVALVLPFVAGTRAFDTLTDALRTNGSGNGSGTGTGGVTQFASLKGTLTRGEPVDLMTVQVPTDAPVEPYYLRQTVLDVFTGDGWAPAAGRDLTDLQRSGLLQDPVRPSLPTYDFNADVDVSGLTGLPPTFGDTRGVAGLPDDIRWDSARGTFADGRVDDGVRYTVGVSQPNPTEAQLDAGTRDLPGGFPGLWRAVPRGLDPLVGQLTQQVTGDRTSPYEQAKALEDWFTDSANGFRYSLDVPEGDSDDDVANFLRNRQGFCQQYAATMAVMLRVADIPSRVVVGYTHTAPDREGRFTVSTRDAHAWVEAYFGGVGWIPFDPTPLVGSDLERSVTPPWQLAGSGPGTGTVPSAGAVPTSSATSGPNRAEQGLDDPAGAAVNDTQAAATTPDHSGRWLGLIVAVVVVLGLLFAPALWRVRRARARRRAAGDDPTAVAEACFASLRDLADDLDLGWSNARTPRVTGVWLTRHGAAAGDVDLLVAAVETARYGRGAPGQDRPTLFGALDRVEDALRAHADRRDRLRARWWPRSVVGEVRRRTRARVTGIGSAFGSWADRRAETGRR